MCSVYMSFSQYINNVFDVSLQILFLNKVDLFRDKILNSDRHLRLYFQQYNGVCVCVCISSCLCMCVSVNVHVLHIFAVDLGPDRDIDAAARFIQQEFMDRNLNKTKIIYPHFTTATDTSNIKVMPSYFLSHDIIL